MSKRSYIDFDLTLRAAGAAYEAQATSGDASVTNAFPLPFSERELDDFFSIFGGRRVRRMESPQLERARAFGGRLYEAVFNEELDALLAASLADAGKGGKGLRIRLRLDDAPDLVNIPWEYLYRRASDDFFALSNWTPIVRFLDIPDRMPAADLEPPLRILVMISNPVEYQDTLDVDREWERLQDAFADLKATGHVHLKKLAKATEQELQRELRRNDYHIFHFIGHGEFNEREQDGVLLLEDDHRRTKLVTGRGLGTILRDSLAMRLVVLNNCEGARASDTDPFAGAAQSLIQKGLPAVTAMQFEVTDDAAIRFAHEFYAGLSDGYPADAALAEGRKNIYQGATKFEFGSPVLYLSAEDGVIFNIVGRPEAGDVETPAADDRQPAGTGPGDPADQPDIPSSGDVVEEPAGFVSTEPQVEEPRPAPVTPVPAAEPAEPSPPRSSQAPPATPTRDTSQASSPPPPSRPSGRRGLYVTLGAAAAAIVVVGSIVATSGGDTAVTTLPPVVDTSTPTSTTAIATTAAPIERVEPVFAEPPTVADPIGTPLAIDGNDDDWDSRFLYPSEHQVFGADTIEGDDDLDGLWRVAWDDEFLYLFAEVIDDELVQVNTGTSLFRGDAVATYFDSDLSDDAPGAQLSDDDFAFFFSAASGQDWVRLVPTSDGGGFGADGAITSDRDLAARVDNGFDDGYNVEVRIPWRLLGVSDPQPGQQFRMTLDVSDNDTPGTSQQEAMISNSVGRTAARQAFPEVWELMVLGG